MTKSATGIGLIILGVIILAYHGFTYTSHDKVIDLGPIQASADRDHYVHLPAILGGVVLAAGVVLLVTAKRRE